MTKEQHYMTYPERIRLEEKLRYKVPVSAIARELGFSRQTIYNEIKRGSYHRIVERHGYYYDESHYSADVGQQKMEKAAGNKGRPLKIGKDIAYADFLERKILTDRFSPAAALAEARRAGYRTSICVTTLYSYIDQGIFFALTNSHLWEKPGRKPRKKDSGEQKKAHPRLPSIEDRPDKIARREEDGHWEMDLVVGPQKGSSVCLLTLTERLSRQELIFKIANRQAAAVRAVFDRLERTMPNFYDCFKSITTDNGPEFLEYELLKKSVLGGERFQVWYCHSYAAWEKGANENHNRMLRRFFPKGTDFSRVTKKRIAQVQDWMNSYPRRILGWKTPNEMAA